MSTAGMESVVVEASMRSLRKPSWKFWIAISVLSVIVIIGIAAWIIQLRKGMGVAGYTDRSFWAIYIANVVTFIGFSYGGAVVSAILLLTGANWRAPLSRMAEGMALVTVLIGAAFIFPHLGRPDRLLNMITHANPRSPVFWDMVAIITYTFATVVFFLLPLVPDLAILRGAHPEELGRFRFWLYQRVSKGWVGSPSQRSVLRKASTVMAILIIPLAVSVHSVLSWAFSLVSRPGWHESIWAPYFVIAALYSGVALAILVIAGFRKGYHLEAHINSHHFVRLGYIMTTLGAVYAYLTFADLLPSAYVGERGPVAIIYAMLTGKAAAWFWFFIISGVVIPIILVALPWTRNTKGMVVASILVVFAMWIKRMLMIVETSGYDRLSMSFGGFFHFTWVSIAITLAGTAAIPLLLMLLFHFVPLLAIDEMVELRQEALPQKVDKASAGIVMGVLLLVGLSAVSISQAQPAFANHVASLPGNVVVTIVAVGPKVDITATVTSEGQPVADAPISFYASTPMFVPGKNRITLGQVNTDSTGVAKMSYLSAENGLVTFFADYYFNVEESPATGQTQVQIAGATSPYVATTETRPLDANGRELVRILFAVVIAVFIIVIVQVVRIRRLLRAPATEPQLVGTN